LGAFFGCDDTKQGKSVPVFMARQIGSGLLRQRKFLQGLAVKTACGRQKKRTTKYTYSLRKFGEK
jgi:hypothetical protein